MNYLKLLTAKLGFGAFPSMCKNKKELLWEANFLQKKNTKHTMDSLLFKEAPIAFQLPALNQQPLNHAIDEVKLLGFPL